MACAPTEFSKGTQQPNAAPVPALLQKERHQQCHKVSKKSLCPFNMEWGTKSSIQQIELPTVNLIGAFW